MANTSITYHDLGTLRKLVFRWTANHLGTVAATTRRIRGVLIKGITDANVGWSDEDWSPSTTLSVSASPEPTDNYDIVITDEEGVDVLGNCDDDLLDRDEATTEEVYFLIDDAGGTTTSVQPAVADKLTITVTNAGNGGTGELHLYYYSHDI